MLRMFVRSSTLLWYKIQSSISFLGKDTVWRQNQNHQKNNPSSTAISSKYEKWENKTLQRTWVITEMKQLLSFLSSLQQSRWKVLPELLRFFGKWYSRQFKWPLLQTEDEWATVKEHQDSLAVYYMEIKGFFAAALWRSKDCC